MIRTARNRSPATGTWCGRCAGRQGEHRRARPRSEVGVRQVDGEAGRSPSSPSTTAAAGGVRRAAARAATGTACRRGRRPARRGRAAHVAEAVEHGEGFAVLRGRACDRRHATMSPGCRTARGHADAFVVGAPSAGRRRRMPAFHSSPARSPSTSAAVRRRRRRLGSIAASAATPSAPRPRSAMPTRRRPAPRRSPT